MEKEQIFAAFGFEEPYPVYHESPGLFSFYPDDDETLRIEVRSYGNLSVLSSEIFIVLFLDRVWRAAFCIWGDGEEDPHWSTHNRQGDVERLRPWLRVSAFNLGFPVEVSAHEVAIYAYPSPGF